MATALLVIAQAGLLAEAIATAFLDGAGLADLAGASRGPVSIRRQPDRADRENAGPDE